MRQSCLRTSPAPTGSVDALRLISYMSPGFPPSLFERIGEIVGAEVRFDTERSGPAPGDDPFARGEADLGWICSTSFVDLALRATAPSITLVGVAWVPDDEDAAGRPVYFGDLLAAPGRTIGSVADLRGRRVACNDPVSLSGHHALRIALRRAGLDPDTDVDLVFTGGHHASLDRVVAGTVDAAVIDSVVRTTRARRQPAVADLSPVARLGPWPVQPLVASSTLPQTSIAAVRRRLLDAATNDRRLRRELAAAGLRTLVEVDDRHYAAVHAAYAVV